MTQAPLTRSIETILPALGAAVAGDQIVGDSPFDGTVTGCTFTPEAAITGATATKRTLTLVNKGQVGLGTTVIATLDFVTGVNGVAFDEKAFTLSAVAGATTVAAGDVLALVETIASTGTANPGGQIAVAISRAAAGA